MAVSQSLTLTQSSQSVSGNYSKVRILWKSTQTGESHNDNTRTAYYYVSINGGAETKYSVSYTLPKGKTKTILDVTIQVNHKADGTGTVKVRTWMDTRISAGEVTQSKTLTLSTIPRATTPTLSATSMDMGEEVTITLNRAVSDFTHDLAYSFDGADYVDIATSVGTAYSWSVPDHASSIPNAASGTMTIRCITKNGSTTIGTKTVNLTAKVPASVTPTLSVVATEATAKLADQFGTFIQNKSKLTVQITATGAKGSTIKSYKTTLAGQTYTDASFTSGVLPSAGVQKMVTTVTDSRGRTASKTTNMVVLEYTKPAIQIFQVHRCTEDGTAKDDGNWVKIRYKYNLPSLGGGNTAKMTLEYKRRTAAETDYTTLLSGSAITADETVVPATPLTSDYTFDLRLTVKDYFNAVDEATALLPSAEVILDIGANGDALSIGGTAEEPGFTTKWKLRTAGGRAVLVLPDEADLNAYMTPNTYAGNGATTARYSNCPLTTATSFTLEVEAGGGGGQLTQRLTACSKGAARVYMRSYYDGAWGEWHCTNYETAWQIATVASSFALYYPDKPIQYRRSGGTVEIRGVIKPAEDIPYSATDWVTITTLPEDYRPGGLDAWTVCQGSVNCIWLLRVTTGGAVQLSRYRNGGENTTATTAVWLPFNFSFLV